MTGKKTESLRGNTFLVTTWPDVKDTMPPLLQMLGYFEGSIVVTGNRVYVKEDVGQGNE